MSFIALTLTLCTMLGSDKEQCNTYFIDSFAGDASVVKTVAMGDQWGDCMESNIEETHLAREAATRDHATKPTAKDGVSTGYRQAYLKRFNIVEDVKSIDIWEYSCAKIKNSEMP